MKRCLSVLLSAGLLTVILSGCDRLSDYFISNDSSQNETEAATEAATETATEAVTETATDAVTENAEEDADTSLPFYGTWEVKDYQSSPEMQPYASESFLGKTITYGADSVIVDGEKLVWKIDEDDIIYYLDNSSYNYDELTEIYETNLGEWWNGISEVTKVSIAPESDVMFFGKSFFVADSETIWIYYMGVFYLAKNAES